MSEKPKAEAQDKNENENEDESRKRFKEALARKQHAAGVNKVGHGPDRQGLPASNDKRRQQFRRKSGG